MNKLVSRSQIEIGFSPELHTFENNSASYDVMQNSRIVTITNMILT